MNKLIIIGNGFDIAHNLKTKYSDFIEYYFKKLKDDLLKKYSYIDDFYELTIEKNNSVYHYATSKYKDPYPDETSPTIWFKKVNEYKSEFFDKYILRIKSKSELFARLVEINANRWVDIENEYFKILVENTESGYNAIKKINDDFSNIRKKLLSYLSHIENNTKTEEIPELNKLFLAGKPERILFLNFNYTKTLEQYAEQCTIENSTKYNYIRINYIHGNLSETKGKPIFGIGDEHHDEYKKLKSHEYLTELFKFNKSTWYLKNNNISELVTFIKNWGPYNVEIYGHSCGISDRTLLKKIFSTENLNKINIFYHETEEKYTDTTIEILRHFDNPDLFIEKVSTFNESKPMPQLTYKTDETNI